MMAQVPKLELPDKSSHLSPSPAELVPQQSSTTNLPLTKLSVVTYNIWFDEEYFFEERAAALLNLLLQADADIVCLQEVIPLFISSFISNNEVLKEKYKYISDLIGNTVHPYGVLMLSKYPFSRLQLIKLETQMARKFLLADFFINDQLFGVGTVHLESLNSAPVRYAQLQTINTILSDEKYKHWLLMGDFNFDSQINYENRPGKIENEEMKELMPNAIDTWLFLHPDDPSSGKTYDTDINLMLPLFLNERMRYDRVMLHSQPTGSDKRWEPVHTHLLGTEQFQPNLWPSDHFGVFVEFKFVNSA